MATEHTKPGAHAPVAPKIKKGHSAALVVKKEFSAFGIDYTKGDIVKTKHHMDWPEGTLRNRLEGEDVAWANVEADEDED